jgi:hypothetical protein
LASGPNQPITGPNSLKPVCCMSQRVNYHHSQGRINVPEWHRFFPTTHALEFQVLNLKSSLGMRILEQARGGNEGI